MRTKKYELRHAQVRNTLPEINLMLRPHNGIDTLVSTFGGGYYFAAKQMEKHYWHSNKLSDITFAPVTSSETISYAAFDWNVFSTRTINTGLSVRTNEGIYVNADEALIKIPLKTSLIGGWEFGLDEKVLEKLKNNTEKVNGIYLGEKDFAFAPWKSIKLGTQTPEEFAEGGLARALEHTSEKVASKLFKIASSYRYKTVKMPWIEPAKKPTIGEISLSSEHSLDYNFEVHGNSWNDNNNLREKPDSPYYCNLETGGTAFGRIFTNKGKLV